MEEAAEAASMAKKVGRPEEVVVTHSMSVEGFRYIDVIASVLNKILITFMRHDVCSSYVCVHNCAMAIATIIRSMNNLILLEYNCFLTG